MTTLVVCIDRDSPATAACLVVGRDAVESLITRTGVVDPEVSRVNCLLEGLAVADELEAEESAPVLAVVGGGSDSVGSDREIASQIDSLVAEHNPDSAVVVVDSADDERLVPIIESRDQVDAVDRVVVRQARDIESTYYLLKQFLADEELRRRCWSPSASSCSRSRCCSSSPARPSPSALSRPPSASSSSTGTGIDAYLSRLTSRPGKR